MYAYIRGFLGIQLLLSLNSEETQNLQVIHKGLETSLVNKSNCW